MEYLRDLPPRSSSRRLSPFFLRSRVSSSASSSRLRFSSFFRALAFPSLDDEDEDEDEDDELELESLFLRFFFDPFRSRFRRRFLSSESLSDDDESRPDDSPLDDEDTFEDISRSRFATSGSNRLSALSRASRLSPSSSIEPPLPSVLLER